VQAGEPPHPVGLLGPGRPSQGVLTGRVTPDGVGILRKFAAADLITELVGRQSARKPGQGVQF